LSLIKTSTGGKGSFKNLSACASLVMLGLWFSASIAQPSTSTISESPDVSQSAAPPSSTAQTLYAAASKDLLQLRILLKNGRSQSSTGSGFLIGTGDLVVTNYHVVSRLALEPETYTGEYVDTDGRRGSIELIAVDVLRDLAVVRVDRHGHDFFKLPETLTQLHQGQNLYSLGNPLDLGFAISEGTYNGISSRGFSDQLMFTGALNPGMSGGPNITAQGEVAGVNVSHRRDGELVSFLVPAHYVQQLLDSAREQNQAPEDFKSIIGEQLLMHQQIMADHLLNEPLPSKTLGNYKIPVRESEQLRCWGSSDTNPKSTYTTHAIQCGMESVIYVSDNVRTGSLSFNHQLINSKENHALRFSRVASNFFRGQIWSYHKGEEHTGQQCTEEFITNGDLPLRAVLCATAYRKFEGLYNFTLLTITMNGELTALKSLYNIDGVSYENGLKIAQGFLQAVGHKTDADEPALITTPESNLNPATGDNEAGVEGSDSDNRARQTDIPQESTEVITE